eukprot:s916_g4.t1
MAATNLTDSVAALDRQAAQLGLHNEYVTGLKAAGLNTLGKLAFACGQPGTPATEANIRTLLQDAAPSRAITVGDLATMRRLIFEAQTSVIAQSRALADPAADPSTHKLPQAERMARITDQRTRLTGLNLEGPMEVAYGVYDLVSGMMQADALRYLHPSKCITRMQEITMTKPPKELRLDATGQGIMVKDVQGEQQCSVSTELDVMEAMTRRSLAFDVVGLINYEIFQKWIHHLFQVMRQAAPPGFKQPNITQLLRADRQAFVRLQELTREGIKPKPDGTRPLDDLVEKLPQDHTVMCKQESPDEAQKAHVSLEMAEEEPVGTNPCPCPQHDPEPRDEGPTNAATGGAVDEDAEPFAIEFCSGTAGLTAQFRKLGMTASFGVDRIVKGACKAPVVKLDLGTPEGEELAASWIRSKQCKYCHYGLPCGTSSRAREIPLGPDQHGPRPLRSDEFPDGLPHLEGKDKERLRLANLVYEAACRLILLCHTLGVHWTVEQPARSIFWLTSFWKTVLATITPWFVTFHSCMYGGLRPKRTTLAGDLECLQELAAECTNQHVHLPWGTTQYGFATAEEVEYPLQLCKRWAQLVYDAIKPTYTQPKSALPAHPDKRARAMTGKQTKKSLAFIPEWSHIDSKTTTEAPKFTIGTKLKEAVTVKDTTFPAYARILRITQKTIVKTGEETQLWEVAFGVPWEVESFIQEASIFEGLATGIREAIINNVEKDPSVIARDRAIFLRKWTTRAAELAEQEKILHNQLPPHRKLILEGKRFLVLREMLREMDFPDKTIVDDIISGFDLVGQAGAEGLLPPDFQPATLSVADLERSAERSNKAIMHSSKSSGSATVDEELWRKTLEEVSKGWLEELEELPKDGGRVSRRFAVVQSDKVRPIDNYSESQVNNGITVTNKCTVDGVDTIAATACLFMKKMRKRRKKCSLVGRSFDLKSAYRQLAVSDESLKWARLAVYDPETKRTRCFQQYSLPFGAKSSVVAFLRCARLLQWICLKLDVVLACYFDDFVCLSTPILARSAELTFETLLDLLGWRFDRTGEKATELGSSVSALGVVVNLEKIAEGLLEVQNTEKRKQDVCAQIAKALDEGVLTSQAAASLKGRLGFAEGQLFGRATRRLINELGAHASTPPRATS